MADDLQLLDSSPTNVVSSLQHRLSPSGGWKIRTNELAVEEIRRERRAVIESGRLKGRRLFEAEMGLGEREKICNCWNCLTQENDARSVLFCNSENDHEIGSGESKEEKKVVTSVETRREAYGGRGKGRRWIVAMAWLAVASIVYAICIIPIKSFSGYGDARELLIVPT